VGSLFTSRWSSERRQSSGLGAVTAKMPTSSQVGFRHTTPFGTSPSLDETSLGRATEPSVDPQPAAGQQDQLRRVMNVGSKSKGHSVDMIETAATSDQQRNDAASERPATTVKDTGPSATSVQSVTTGISGFIARVLEQLSLSSWLPAIVFVGNAALLFALHGKKSIDIVGAVRDLIQLNWGILIVLLFALVITAVITQAFEFETIRLMEGYVDTRSNALVRPVLHRIRRHQTKRAQLEASITRARRTAIANARRRAMGDDLATEEDLRNLEVYEYLIFNKDIPEQLMPYVADANDFEWKERADAADLYVLDAMEARFNSYPAAHRVLPTRLGNVLRAAEDTVPLDADEDLEGFILRHNDLLPSTIRSEHAEYRSRLEMYCGLALILVALTGLAGGTLWGYTDEWGWRVVIPAVFLALTWVSYQAAVASASGYGQALKEASGWVEQHVELSGGNATRDVGERN
jgi:hypothetical protein